MSGRGRVAAVVVAVLVVASLVLAAVVPLVEGLLAPGPAAEAPVAPARPTGGEEGEYEASLRATIASDPGNAVAQISLARLLGLRGATAEALRHYEQAVALRPEETSYRIDFGRALAEAGHRGDAELQYRRALEQEPGSAEVHYWLGELYRTWQPPREADAIASYRSAIAAGPTSVAGQLATEALRQLGVEAMATPEAALVAPNREQRGVGR